MFELSERKIDSGDETVTWVAEHLGMDALALKKALLMRRPNNSFTINADDLFESVKADFAPAYELERKFRMANTGALLGLAGVMTATFAFTQASLGYVGAGLAGLPIPWLAVALVDRIDAKFAREMKPTADRVRNLRQALIADAAAFDRKYGTGEFVFEATSDMGDHSVPDLADNTIGSVPKKIHAFVFDYEIEPTIPTFD